MKIETGLIIGNQIIKLIKLIPIIIIENPKQIIKIKFNNINAQLRPNAIIRNKIIGK